MVNAAIISICVLLCLWLVVSHFGVVWKIFYNSILGMLALMLVNFLGAPFHINVGVNAVTCLVCGLLGLPGFIMLYILKLLI